MHTTKLGSLLSVLVVPLLALGCSDLGHLTDVDSPLFKKGGLSARAPVPESILVDATSDITHGVVSSVSPKFVEQKKYRGRAMLAATITELTGNGELKFLASQSPLLTDLTVITSAKRELVVDVVWPGDQIIEAGSRVRTCAQIVTPEGPLTIEVCVDLDPILESL